MIWQRYKVAAVFRMQGQAPVTFLSNCTWRGVTMFNGRCAKFENNEKTKRQYRWHGLEDCPFSCRLKCAVVLSLIVIRSRTELHKRLRRLGRAGKQSVLGEKFDHEAIEEPGLLDLASVAGAWEDL